MLTLQSRITKRKRRRTPTKPFTLASVTRITDLRAGHPSRARELYHYYAAIQRKVGVWALPYDTDRRTRTCFRKLAAWFAESDASGHGYDPALYMRAHQRIYGRLLRPRHLISVSSKAIYEAALEERAAEEFTLTPAQEAAYYSDLIEALSDVRGETPQDVAALLRRCGVM